MGKLTLSIDDRIIKEAKDKLRGERSLSALVQGYLENLIKEQKLSALDDNSGRYPITSDLLGIASLKSKESPEKLIAEYLEEKYK